jgi:hypothetical protein
MAIAGLIPKILIVDIIPKITDEKKNSGPKA